MTVRQWFRAIAVCLFAFGIVCLPNPGGSPKRLTSLFSFLADSGSVLHLGLILVGISIVLFAVSFIGRDHD